METPVLEAQAGGADARPFMTHHNALGRPFALRIATGAAPSLLLLPLPAPLHLPSDCQAAPLPPLPHQRRRSFPPAARRRCRRLTPLASLALLQRAATTLPAVRCFHIHCSIYAASTSRAASWDASRQVWLTKPGQRSSVSLAAAGCIAPLGGGRPAGVVPGYVCRAGAEADGGGGDRACVRDRPHLPQRGHLHPSQP